VRAVLTVVPVYMLIALDVPKTQRVIWAIEALTKDDVVSFARGDHISAHFPFKTLFSCTLIP
jgi:hypothetical protein